MTSLSYSDAFHLLSRAGFGGTPQEIEELAARGREGAVDFLINYESIDNQAVEDFIGSRIDISSPTAGEAVFIEGQPIVIHAAEMPRWWLARMILTKRPLEEKLTLFWHNHFATSMDKVLGREMLLQNRTLRQFALARFDDLVSAIAKDPAMLLWLDGVLNEKGSPNENFARELQELFTMGSHDVVTGEANYTEDDVKEIARAFTGWSYKTKVKKGLVVLKFFIKANLHDNGLKTIYGRTANFGGQDVIDTICLRRATARYLVKEIFAFFVFPLSDSAEDKAIIEPLADVYISSNHSLKTLFREIFISDIFYTDRAKGGQIKSPSELIASSFRLLGANYQPRSTTDIKRQGDFNFLIRSRHMGQYLFHPPDVNGWTLGEGWLNSTAMIERYNFANYLLASRDDSLGFTNELLERHTRPSAQETVENFLKIMGMHEISTEVVQPLANYLETDAEGNPEPFEVNSDTIDQKVRGLVHLLMCLPEFHLN